MWKHLCHISNCALLLSFFLWLLILIGWYLLIFRSQFRSLSCYCLFPSSFPLPKDKKEVIHPIDHKFTTSFVVFLSIFRGIFPGFPITIFFLNKYFSFQKYWGGSMFLVMMDQSSLVSRWSPIVLRNRLESLQALFYPTILSLFLIVEPSLPFPSPFRRGIPRYKSPITSQSSRQYFFNPPPYSFPSSLFFSHKTEQEVAAVSNPLPFFCLTGKDSRTAALLFTLSDSVLSSIPFLQSIRNCLISSHLFQISRLGVKIRRWNHLEIEREKGEPIDSTVYIPSGGDSNLYPANLWDYYVTIYDLVRVQFWAWKGL